MSVMFPKCIRNGLSLTKLKKNSCTVKKKGKSGKVQEKTKNDAFFWNLDSFGGNAVKEAERRIWIVSSMEGRQSHCLQLQLQPSIPKKILLLWANGTPPLPTQQHDSKVGVSSMRGKSKSQPLSFVNGSAHERTSTLLMKWTFRV